VPWKTPWVNALGLAYALVALAAVPGWRSGAAGLAARGGRGLAGAWPAPAWSRLVASWAYLRAVYGDFGVGASIGALLAASAALQVLGLYPALKLRALLRSEVRQDLGARRG